MKILLIEDDREIAESLQEALAAFAHTMHHQADLASGLRKANHEQFDLLIVDRMLPDGDGLDLCRFLRQSGLNTPILMLTAKDLTPDVVSGLDAGADDYLTKPFALSELLARIKALTRRSGEVLPEIITINNLSLNQTTMTVTRAGQVVKLAPKEYELLDYLVRNRNQVLDKYQILDRVWLHEADVAINTVEVFIGYLRNKIDRPFPDSPPLIHTIRGKGYLLGERG